MRDRTAPSDPYVPPGPLDEIVADLRERGIRPTQLNVIRAAIAARIDEEALLALLAMAQHQDKRRGVHRR